MVDNTVDVYKFVKEHAYLSTHYPITITLEEFPGRVFPTATNAYWALIYPDMANELSYSEGADARERLRTLNANEANACGLRRSNENFRKDHSFALSPQGKVMIMARVTKEKFDQHPNFRELLLSTGDGWLIYTNTWEDRFWGVTVDENSMSHGDNHLGRILMKLRSNYRESAKETA